MKKVKDYLDSFCLSSSDNYLKIKNNGHYGLFGHWSYNIEEDYSSLFNEFPKYHIKTGLLFHSNNETLLFNFFKDYKSIGLYGYAQTYAHIPRLKLDNNGYYQRWTEDEIINYIQKYKNIITRNKIIEKILKNE